MPILLTSLASSVVQLITVLFIFAFVLIITYFTTKWIGNYKKDQSLGDNIAIIETKRIDQNKMIEIVRIGDRYFALGLGKETVTTIAEISKDSLQFPEVNKANFSFKEFLNKAKENGEN